MMGARAERPTLAGTRPARRAASGELRIRVQASDVASFVERYSGYFVEDRIFIGTRAPHPPGTAVRFCLCLRDGEPIVRGRGVVRGTCEDGRPGMEVAFVPVDVESAAVLELVAARRRAADYDDGPTDVSDPSPGADPPREEVSQLIALEPESSVVIPANPFGGVSDGAIEHFVEWSIGAPRRGEEDE